MCVIFYLNAAHIACATRLGSSVHIEARRMIGVCIVIGTPRTVIFVIISDIRHMQSGELKKKQQVETR